MTTTLNVQVQSQHYNFLRYVDHARWASYYQQISETLRFAPRKVLVVGVGDGIVVQCLRKQGIEVCTMDFDPELAPDFAMDIRQIDQISQQFDVIVCCQVLEHLPFSDFAPTLDKIMSRTKQLVLSLPIQHFRWFTFHRVQQLFFKKVVFLAPKFFKNFKFDGEHYWEIGTKNYFLGKISKIISRNYKIQKQYVVENNLYHQFFIVTKN